MASPAIWGPHLWKSIHYIALGYPDDKPTETDRESYKDFFMNFHKVVPCVKCAKNYIRHLREVPAIDEYLSSNTRLFEWTWMLHNIVNKELGKRVVSLDAAKKLYIQSGGGDDRQIRWMFAIAILIFLLLVAAAIFFWWRRKGAKSPARK